MSCICDSSEINRNYSSFPFSWPQCTRLAAFTEAIKLNVPWHMTMYCWDSPVLNHHFREWLERNSSLMKSQGAITITQFKAAQGTLRQCIQQCSLLWTKHTTTQVIWIASDTIVPWNCIPGAHRNAANKLATLCNHQGKLQLLSIRIVLLELNGSYAASLLRHRFILLRRLDPTKIWYIIDITIL